MFSIDGLVSGLDTTSIIEGLVSLQESQVERLTARKAVVIGEQTAFQGIEARVLSLRSTMSRLNRTTGSAFEKSIGTSSDESILTVNAGEGAIPGSYVVKVNSLAKAHQIGSQSIDDSVAGITTGDISIRIGDRPATNITINDSNNSVDGLVEAINAQSDDVNASVIHDQANGGQRILLTSRHTGKSNEIVVENNLAADANGLVRPDFSGAAVQDASNAQIQLGDGAGAIIAEFDTNSIEGLIEDVTLEVTKADVDQDITINVSRDTESATTAIQDFVDEYNSLISYIDDQTQFNVETGFGGPLLGNRNVSNIRNKLSALVTEPVAGLDSSLNRFSQLGIEIDFKGKLTVDSAKLSQAVNGELDGIESSDIQRLFGLGGSSDQSGVEFLLGSTRTQSSTNDYQVDILQAAERATVSATTDLASQITIDGTNNQLSLSLDGLDSETLQLTSGTYTQQELADLIESQINHSDALRGSEINVAINAGKLELTSQRYGLSSEISNIAGSAIATLGFTGSESGQGKDVAGSYIVDGEIETATGSGRVLMGDADNANTADLQLRILLDPSQVSDGVEANLSVTRGITSKLDQYFGDIVDPDVGTMKTVNEDFDLRAESIDDSIARVNAISESKKAYLIEEFTALERALSSLQTTSSFLTSQLGSI
ncbi:MAG: flagellar filament capping protein FliD [Planctomycetota bacterium]